MRTDLTRRSRPVTAPAAVPRPALDLTPAPTSPRKQQSRLATTPSRPAPPPKQARFTFGSIRKERPAFPTLRLSTQSSFRSICYDRSAVDRAVARERQLDLIDGDAFDLDLDPEVGTLGGAGVGYEMDVDYTAPLSPTVLAAPENYARTRTRSIMQRIDGFATDDTGVSAPQRKLSHLVDPNQFHWISQPPCPLGHPADPGPDPSEDDMAWMGGWNDRFLRHLDDTCSSPAPICEEWTSGNIDGTPALPASSASTFEVESFPPAGQPEPGFAIPPTSSSRASSSSYTSSAASPLARRHLSTARLLFGAYEDDGFHGEDALIAQQPETPPFEPSQPASVMDDDDELNDHLDGLVRSHEQPPQADDIDDASSSYTGATPFMATTMPGSTSARSYVKMRAPRVVARVQNEDRHCGFEGSFRQALAERRAV
jgi:hypothetical protein